MTITKESPETDSWALYMGVSEGESESEALQNIREAIELYLEPVDDLAGVGKEIREIVL